MGNVLPNSDCPYCGGDGIDMDPYDLFEYTCVGSCDRCWSTQGFETIFDKPLKS